MEGWIDPMVLEWEARSLGGREHERELKARAYDLWQHADGLLGQADDVFHRGDLVGSLKRAIDHRLSTLNKLYKWERMKLLGMPSGKRKLEQLEYLGIVRPLMVRHIIDIRNKIEHQDAKPPTKKRCAEMVEFVWYFLRSTDSLVNLVADSYSFIEDKGDDGNPYEIEVNVGPANNWQVRLWGWIPNNLFSISQVNDWALLRGRSFPKREKVIQQRASHWSRSTLRMHRSEDSNDILIDAQLVGPDRFLVQVIQRYFSVS